MKAVALVVLASTLGMAGCAVNSGVVTTAPDTYYVSRQAATGFTGLSGLYPEALKEANEQCAKMNKQYQELARKASEPPYILGNFPRVEIQFKCVTTGPSKAEECFEKLASDPELSGLSQKVALAKTNDQTFSMLSDTSKPTSQEKKLLKVWGGKRDVCIKSLREELQANEAPLPIVTLNSSSLMASQLLIADLMNGNLTFSDFSAKRQDLSTFTSNTANNIQVELRKETQESRLKAEQLAIEAQRNQLMRQKIYSDSAMQQQQITSNEQINRERIQAERMRSMRTPTTTTTNCHRIGSQVNCTTQ